MDDAPATTWSTVTTSVGLMRIPAPSWDPEQVAVSIWITPLSTFASKDGNVSAGVVGAGVVGAGS